MEVIMNMTIANYVLLDERSNLYAGDNCDGLVFVATVNLDGGDRFKYAPWVPATKSQEDVYWVTRKSAEDFGKESFCAETGESSYHCTCGWH
jgi:hypothetical protein